MKNFLNNLVFSFFIDGLLAIIAGVFIFIFPLLLGMIVGIFFIAIGIKSIILAAKLQKISKKIDKFTL